VFLENRLDAVHKPSAVTTHAKNQKVQRQQNVKNIKSVKPAQARRRIFAPRPNVLIVAQLLPATLAIFVAR
jgi:hypothetical protein